MRLGFGFYSKTEELLSQNDIKEFLINDQDFFIEYVETYWLERYFKMKAIARNTQLPSITSRLSENPPSQTNEFKSKTESYALKSVLAEEWVNHFHSELEKLPNDYQELIKLKYLNRRADGRPYEDDVVYPKMNISRTKYYQLKKEALEEFGRSLYGYSVR